jgi:pyruvate,water dikinase
MFSMSSGNRRAKSSWRTIQSSMKTTSTDHPVPTGSAKWIRWFREISIADVPLVGGKNASLGEMIRELSDRGVRVPDGFAVTAEAYFHFLNETGLDERLRLLLEGLDTKSVQDLQNRGHQARQLIQKAELPVELQEEITAAYQRLRAEGTKEVAVRSSATAEDLPNASFAGQQETYLNVEGPCALLEACRNSFASLFTDRAISYRTDMGFDHFKIGLSVGVQRMVRSDLASSGVMFTIDTETGFKDSILINAAWGLGENVVQGTVTPDEYCVFKPTLRLGFRPIIRKKMGTKEFRMVYDKGHGERLKNVAVPEKDRTREALHDDDILELARWGCIIEEHYSLKNGHPTPMDIEWAKDGATGELYIVQARPETVQSRRPANVIESYRLTEKGRTLAAGQSIGCKVASGTARYIKGTEFLHEFQPGEILVAEKTDPDWEPVMKKAAGIVTNRGGRTCHAAIISRELGLPAVIGTGNATEAITTGQDITVSCAEGETGRVYDGRLAFEVDRTSLVDMATPRTRVMMNVADPEKAFRYSFTPNSGVGLAREEFIITNFIKVHPMALVHYQELDRKTKQEVDEVVGECPDRTDYFVERLAQGVAMIAAAFYPKDVILRLSDFKTNEYANLIGGRHFEPVEENPMIGFRGASRYYDPRYRQGFALECRAVRKVRSEMGLKNLKLMIPFCRTVEEGKRVQMEMAAHGLRRGEDGLELYVMCEIPNNVILADEFAEIFDGFSIGSNDLTQLVLGVDRDSEIVARLFDERDPGVMKMIASVIRAARAKGRKIGICGQAPSDYPEFTEFLIEQRIDSISLNPDTVLKVTLTILEKEKLIAKVEASVPTMNPLITQNVPSPALTH